MTELYQEQGEVLVTRTSLTDAEEQEQETIRVRPFVTAPAYVETHVGCWFPTGEMMGLKVDVTVRLPCYKEEVARVVDECFTFCEERLRAEVRKLRRRE